MNIADMTNHLAKEAGFKKDDARKALDAFMDGTKDILSKGGKVSLKGFGTFEVKDTQAKKARNPRTGEEMKIPAGKRVKFTASDALKDAVKA